MLPFHFITAFWGEEFTDIFLNYTLASQLSPGNLGIFSNDSGHIYKIYTTSKDARTVENSHAFTKLREFITPEIHIIDDLLERVDTRVHKLDVWTMCHKRAIEDARKDRAAMVFLAADAIYADGAFSTLARVVSNGKRLIVYGAYRVDMEDIIPELFNRFYLKGQHCLSIPPRELVRISLNYINNESKMLFWDSPNFDNNWPAYLFWKCENGVLKRGTHLHPIMIYPVNWEETLSLDNSMAIDGQDYYSKAVPDFKDIYVISDSDELCAVALDHKTLYQPYTQKASILRVATWVKRYCNSHHIRFLQTKIRFHAYDISNEWKDVEKESDRVINSILSCLDLYEKAPWIMEEIDEQKNLIDQISSLIINNALTLVRLARELCASGKREEAEKIFHQALNMAPGLEAIHVSLYEFYKEEGHLEKAINHLKQAIKLVPKKVPNNDDIFREAKYYYDLGSMYMELKEYEHARNAFENTIYLLNRLSSLFQDDEFSSSISKTDYINYYVTSCINLARCFIEKGQILEAKNIMDDLLANNAIELLLEINTVKGIYGYYELGKMYSQLMDHTRAQINMEKAIHLMKKISEIYGDNIPDYNTLVDCYTSSTIYLATIFLYQGYYTEAENVLKEILEDKYFSIRPDKKQEIIQLLQKFETVGKDT